MRTYIIVTGTLFALITVAHIARMVAEHMAPSHEPAYLGLTLAAAALSGWAFRLLRRQS
ncbi:MAG: hypothetical protein U0132_23525 [Gemmatimonadaceae bacterium]